MDICKPSSPNNLTDFPKIESPFVREMQNNNYCVISKINDNCEWYMDDDVKAVEKLHGCLNYNQPILTDKGHIKVGKIVNQKLPVKVASYNFNKKIIEFKEIEHYHKAQIDKKMNSIIVRGRFNHSTTKNIVCTPNHRFWTKKGWVESRKLKKGDIVFHFAEIIPEEVKQIVLGGLLGDSSITKHGEYSPRGFAFCHSIKHKKYFDYKKRLLGDMFHQVKSSTSGYSGKELLRGNSIMSPSLSDFIRNHCLVNEKKRITKKWIDAMNPFSIAIWYMDDGACNFPNTQRPRAVFCCNNYDQEEVKILSNKLLNMGIENKISYYKNKKDGLKKYPQLDLSSNGTEKLFDLIFPYVPKSMKYKIHPRYNDFPCVYENKVFDHSSGIIKTKVIDVTNKLPSNAISLSYEYDIKVKDNSNYFVHGILVHNTCCCIQIKEGVVIAMFNRINRIPFIGGTLSKALTEGVNNAFAKSRIILQDGIIWGELIGPKIQKNEYLLDEHEFVPFHWLKKHCYFKSWGKYGKNYDDIEKWFRDGLMPLFMMKRGIKDGFIEGIVFHKLDKDGGTIKMSKLRTDMFSWHKGERHNPRKSSMDVESPTSSEADLVGDIKKGCGIYETRGAYTFTCGESSLNGNIQLCKKCRSKNVSG